jgi:antitoxin (DNA-binding transcriptional repressor) of toxin-antitoxin stability system
MQTLTITKARQNLGGWLKRAVSGEEIGVFVGDKVVAFRPVAVTAADYAETEYGLSKEEVDRAAEKIRAGARADLKAGNFLTLDQLSDRLAAGRKPKRRARAGETAS